MSYTNKFSKDALTPEILLQKLIRFDTTNPPGNEADCIKYVYNLLTDAGIEAKILYDKPERLNLVARLKGQGIKPPLLMYGHVDVVTIEHQDWDYPPFEAALADDCIWGRGALDMKGALSMMICAILKAKSENYVPMGDIILCLVSDEEADGDYGAKYIVENHKDLFKDVKYAIGEIGGFTMMIGGKKFYPIMVSEKQRCGIKATIDGQGGHGSLPIKDGTTARLGEILNILNRQRLPVHITPPVKMMIEALAENMSFPHKIAMKSLLNPAMTNKVLDLMGSNGRVFDAILHNTANATILRGGNKINVIPSKIELNFDIRILPGLHVKDVLEELQNLIGKDIDLEVLFYDKGSTEIDMGLFNTLSQIIKEEEKDGIPIPFVVSGVTDARFFSRLGIQTYGFTPMLLPQNIDFSKLIHNANERIPVKALEFGTESILKLIKTYAL